MNMKLKIVSTCHLLQTGIVNGSIRNEMMYLDLVVFVRSSVEITERESNQTASSKKGHHCGIVSAMMRLIDERFFLFILLLVGKKVSITV